MLILKEALDILFPAKCVICGKLADMNMFNTNICRKCMADFIPVSKTERWQFCLSDPYTGDPYPNLPLYVPFRYKGSIVSAVRGLKFGDCPEIGSLFGCLLGNLMKSEGVRADMITSVPLSSERLKERGYNQASLIAKETARITNIPFVEDVLMRVRNTKGQASLKLRESRISNVSGAFKVRDDFYIEGITIIIIDDVATTGNTLHEVSDSLYKSGAKKVLCAAFASNRTLKNAEYY